MALGALVIWRLFLIQKKKTKIESAKTDPVRFKWGFGEGLLKDKFAFFEAYKCPIHERRKLLAKRPFFYMQKGPCLKRPPNWTGSVFPLLTNSRKGRTGCFLTLSGHKKKTGEKSGPSGSAIFLLS